MPKRTLAQALLFLPLAVAVPLAAALPAAVLTAAPAAAASRLGDLSPFRTIAADAAGMVDKGDLAGAKLRIKDLETTWDESEPSLKPRSAAEWHSLDRLIDHVLTSLRASTPDPAACKQALLELITALDASSKA